jgi:hypothetical protein
MSTQLFMPIPVEFMERTYCEKRLMLDLPVFSKPIFKFFIKMDLQDFPTLPAATVVNVMI